MAVPFRMQMAVFRYILAQKLKGVEKYPLVLMLEPLLACNLQCGGCGKVQYPADILKKRLSPEQCWKAAEECGAPIVSIAGGEPLAHARIDEIARGLMARGKYIFLCTNAILLERNLHRFSPSGQLVFNIHLDGVEKTHDRTVSRSGVHKTAVAAIRKAKSLGHNVMTNSTVYQGESSEEFRRFFDETMSLGVDGMTISPGYAYRKAPRQELFLEREQTRSWFRETLKDWRKKGWEFNHSPFYLDFLEGKRDYDCTPWGNPLRSVFGWQRPCYLMADGGYAETYEELLETTRWETYGQKSGNVKCANCMVHVGYEPSAVIDAFSSPGKFLELVLDIATISGPKKAKSRAGIPAGPPPSPHPSGTTVSAGDGSPARGGTGPS
ncbi:MAG: adenosyl-hopene transferase HpnH [Elusimicrobiota bacterium]